VPFPLGHRQAVGVFVRHGHTGSQLTQRRPWESVNSSPWTQLTEGSEHRGSYRQGIPLWSDQDLLFIFGCSGSVAQPVRAMTAIPQQADLGPPGSVRGDCCSSTIQMSPMRGSGAFLPSRHGPSQPSWKSHQR
jgi:hypothetical protein